MTLRNKLRLIEYPNVHLNAIKRHHPDSEIVVFNSSNRYVNIDLVNEIGLEVQAFIDIDMLLQNHEYADQGIPWINVPLHVIVKYISTMHLLFKINGEDWMVQCANFPSEFMPKHALKIPANPCCVYCTHWLEKEQLADAPLDLGLVNIPFQLNYCLGNSQVSLSDLAALSVGDLLLIKQKLFTLNIASIRLYNFNYSYDQEIIVEDIYNENKTSNPDEREIFFKWTELPVDIEFVLDQQELPLHKLESIEPGTVFKINANAEKQVKIYVNRKLFAAGELVALEDDTLAVEIRELSVTAQLDSGLDKC